MSISVAAGIAYASFSYPVFGFLFNAALMPFFAWFLTVPHTRSWNGVVAGRFRSIASDQR
jgi:hypothetical protein